MEQYIIDELIERVDEILELLGNNEDAFYVAIEVAHQLRDQISEVDVSIAEDE